MITRISIRNFQSHKKTDIDFHPNVNVFVGQSDRGKTAILRAIGWIRVNKPSGDSFRSDWGGDTLVRLETEDEVSITRIKTSKENKYVLDYPDGTDKDALELKAMGQGVPVEIVDALSLPDSNVQQQMDSPFLFSSSSNDVAQLLNRVSGLSVIDRAQAHIDSKIRSLKAKLEFEVEQITESKKQLSEFDNLDQMEAEVKKLEQLEAQIKILEDKKSKIESIVEAAYSIRERLDELSYLSSAEKQVKELIEIQNAIANKNLKASVLDHNLFAIEEIEERKKKYIHIIEAEQIVSSILSLSKKLNSLESEQAALKNNIETVKQTRAEFQTLNTTRTKNEQWWKENAPDECPLCDGEGTLK